MLHLRKSMIAVAAHCLLVSAVVRAGEPSLVYITCEFTTGLGTKGMTAQYYIDDAHQRLLNQSKSEFGVTRSWSKDLIITAMPLKGGKKHITQLNRLTGDLATFTEGEQKESLVVGECKMAAAPKQKF